MQDAFGHNGARIAADDEVLVSEVEAVRVVTRMCMPSGTNVYSNKAASWRWSM